MAVTIKLEDGTFDKETLANCLKSLAHRSFVENDGQELVYASGDYTISMGGYIAAAPGNQPRGWDLNNSHIVEMTFTSGAHKLQLSGLAMDLREIYHARSVDDLRDWNDFSKLQDYEIIGTNASDMIRSAASGNNVVMGRAGDDRLVALGTNDKILGGGGDDVIVVKGDGARVRGDAGSDKFVLKETQTGARILDFDASEDRLDIGYILDDLVRNDNIGHKLRYIGEADFGDGNYELRTDTRQSDEGTITVVELNLRGHEYSVIELLGDLKLGADDFLF
jgi:Ca2+-binding RTX toxin-like protein